MRNKYTKEQRRAMEDLIAEHERFAHTVGERHRLQEAKVALLNRSARSLGAKLSKKATEHAKPPKWLGKVSDNFY